LPEIFASLYDHDAATPKIPINLLRHGPESTPTRLGEISGLGLRPPDIGLLLSSRHKMALKFRD